MMWTRCGCLSINTPPEPNHDDVLYGLLNLKPWDWHGERKQYDDDSVLKQLRRNPGAAMVKYEFKRSGRGSTTCYPLFRIISLGGSHKTVKSCHRAYPEALSVARTDARGNVLHTACTFRSNISIVKYIHRKDATLVRMTNKTGFTPLHLACAYGSSAEVVKLLIKWYPEALDMTNVLGETPHASAVNNHASEEIIAALSSPSSGGRMDATGNLSASASVPSMASMPPPADIKPYTTT
ncbi:hypothetical protein ACHAXR_002239 [Thalassiosira sp. AJA248-18]